MRSAIGWVAASGLALAVGALSCGGDTDLFSSGTGGATTSSGTGGATTSSGTGGATTSSGTGGATTSSGTGGATTSSGTGGAGGSCQPPLADCDGIPANGCETNTDTDLEHCGDCDVPCATVCELGICRLPCDDNLAVDVQDPLLALRAIGLCDGVTAASWVMSDGAAPPASAPQNANYHLGHGVLPDFGPNVNPQEGSRLLALSSGTARRPVDPGYADPGGFDKQYPGQQPPGFPKPIPSCPSITVGEPHDAAAIELTVSPPPGAGGFSFKSKYYAYDWEQYVCTPFADPFLALLSPAPPGQADGNVVFDTLGNTLGPHSELIEVCGCQNGPPCAGGGLFFDCPLGTAELAGTGFEQHAATGWLETQVPIDPDTPFTVRFVIHDSADGVLDSTVLLDDWRWLDATGADPVTTIVANPL